MWDCLRCLLLQFVMSASLLFAVAFCNMWDSLSVCVELLYSVMKYSFRCLLSLLYTVASTRVTSDTWECCHVQVCKGLPVGSVAQSTKSQQC